jgi:hypothetical protein
MKSNDHLLGCHFSSLSYRCESNALAESRTYIIYYYWYRVFFDFDECWKFFDQGCGHPPQDSTIITQEELKKAAGL